MINAVLGLGFWVVILGIYWLYNRARDWWYSSPSQWTVQEYRTGGPVASSRTVTLLPGETIVKPRCAHPQAEPVVLSTGEIVAAVCISCLEPLSARYITDQRAKAERIAYCEHDYPIEITTFGKADRQYTCGACGGWLSDSTWPTFHPG